MISLTDRLTMVTLVMKWIPVVESTTFTMTHQHTYLLF